MCVWGWLQAAKQQLEEVDAARSDSIVVLSAKLAPPVVPMEAQVEEANSESELFGPETDGDGQVPEAEAPEIPNETGDDATRAALKGSWLDRRVFEPSDGESRESAPPKDAHTSTSTADEDSSVERTCTLFNLRPIYDARWRGNCRR